MALQLCMSDISEGDYNVLKDFYLKALAAPSVSVHDSGPTSQCGQFTHFPSPHSSSSTGLGWAPLREVESMSKISGGG